MDVFGLAAVGLVLMALGWTAFERGRIHHHVSQRRRGARRSAAARLRNWSARRLLPGLFGFARRTRRMHLALAAVSGWV